MLGLTFSSKLDWGSYIISIAKTASKKIGALICSMKFLSPEFALYLYKSTIRPCMEYCCHIWAGAQNRRLLVLHLLLLLNPWLIVKDVYVNSFFPRSARPWNSLTRECFPLTHNLNGFKPRINKHLLTVGSL